MMITNLEMKVLKMSKIKTKALYPLVGQVQITFEVRSRIITIETGTNISKNVKRDFNTILEGARLNAIYKHIQKGGTSGATASYISHDIEYFDFGKIKIRRVKRRGKYYTMITQNGKIIRFGKWTYKRNLIGMF